MFMYIGFYIAAIMQDTFPKVFGVSTNCVHTEKSAFPENTWWEKWKGKRDKHSHKSSSKRWGSEAWPECRIQVSGALVWASCPKTQHLALFLWVTFSLDAMRYILLYPLLEFSLFSLWITLLLMSLRYYTSFLLSCTYFTFQTL